MQVTLRRAYRRYVLGVFTIVLTLSYLDSSVIVVLLQPMKEDLHLSDSQLGFLTGIAFALFYATLGLPIARWADRGNRVTIASVAIGLWGLTVMLSLLIGNFFQLLLARIAASVGQAGCMPPIYSLLGDYFPESSERTRAMAVFMLAQPLSSVGYLLGGWLNEHYGWRMTLAVVGIPGLLAAVLLKLTVAEPRSALIKPMVSPRPPRLRDVADSMWRQRSYRHLTVAMVLLFIMGQGLNPWYAAFLTRSHGMGTAELGMWLVVIFGLGMTSGTLLGSYVVNRWFAHNKRGQMRLTAITIALLVPFSLMFLLLPQKVEALMALVPVTIGFSFFIGPTFALMQQLMVDDMRATSMAVMMLLANLIGMGIGPQFVGVLSDALRPTMGNDSLRYAMLSLSFVAWWAAYHFWCVGKTVSQDLSRVCSVKSVTDPFPDGLDNLAS